jgi:uncharacterized protein YqhQ
MHILLMTKEKVTGAELALGGQAVLEGVMMRSRSACGVSVLKDGKIIHKKIPVPKQKFPWLRKVPFVRGVFILADSLKLGYGALQYSAAVATDEEDTSGWMAVVPILISVLLALSLFKFLPFWVSHLVFESSRWLYLFEGILKAAIFVTYIWVISLLPDIKRVFEFHGAEHKAIHCYESYGNSKKLSPKVAQTFSRIHPRCGTTFLFLVILISIFIYAVIPLQFGFWTSFGLRLLFLPVIAGVSYEILRIVPRLSNQNPIRWILFVLEAPGLLLQLLTTREPSLEQLKVAIHSLKKVL